MSCENVQELISSLLDRRVSAGQRESVLAHLESCRKCGAHFELMGSLRTNLRRMSQPAMPADLGARLRVLASHERHRSLTRVSFSARVRFWATRVELAFDNLMRPFAVPVAGGLLSALIMFCILVPHLGFAHNFTDRSFFIYPMGLPVEQVALAGNAVINSTNNLVIAPIDANIPANAKDVVELTIDANGRVSDFHAVRGTLTPEVQSIIMFSQFIPATNLGIPVSGKVRVLQVVQVAGARNVRS